MSTPSGKTPIRSSRRERNLRGMATAAGGTVGQRRWYYPALAMPGIVWLLLLFIMPFYAIAAVAFGGRDQIFALPIPAWNPLEWQFQTFTETGRQLFESSGLQAQFIRTLFYVAVSVVLCLLVGYPVAYYIARYGGRGGGSASIPTT